MEQTQTGLAIIHANRLETLRDLLVNWMVEHPLPPLENEHILVQSNGIGQWLRLALASPNTGCGIAAALNLELPSAFLWQAYRAVLGEDAVPKQSPYDKRQLVWRLLRLLPEHIEREVFAPLNAYLQYDPSERKCYQLALSLADLYDQYQVYRADWLNDWAEGLDQLREGDAEAQPLADDQRWQAELWRLIRADLGDEVDLSRADLHQRFLDACKQLSKRPVKLPRRVLVFGISTLPEQMIEALAALSDTIQVLIAVHNPCRHYWADIIEGRELLRAEFQRQRRREGMPQLLSPEQMHAYAPPLLAAWGKQGRDYIRLLDEFDHSEQHRHWFADSRIDLFDDPAEDVEQLPLLTQLQSDILELEPPPAEPRLLADDDNSLQFHIAHSAQREVEILQDQILARLDADPTLKVRDMIVMVPDIATYQPHIDAVFGRLERDDPRFIPYTLADQNARGQESLLIALEQLLHLPESRLGVSALTDLLEVPAVQARFALDESDIPTLQAWIEGAGIRWGLDSTHRAGLDLPSGLDQNSWLFGLKRMLLGYAVGESEPFDGIEPYDEVAGLEAALAGPLAQLLERLRELFVRLTTPADVEQWQVNLGWLLETFFAPASDQDLLLLEQLGDALGNWSEPCLVAGFRDPLPLPVVREAWLGAVDQPSLNQRFMAGRLTFSTLMPMRAIPFREIFLLGMNDGDYPRTRPPQDFDLMASRYRPGDRSRREDDRYLFLEALLSARDSLYISWVGRSVRDNTDQPPSVLVAQLRELLANHWQLADGRSGKELLSHLDTVYPLQPFSRRYFDGSGLFTYAREWREIHRDITAEDEEMAPWSPDEAIPLTLLGRFLRHPVNTFFADRLGVRFIDELEEAPEQEPFSFDQLQQFQLGQSLIDTVVAEGGVGDAQRKPIITATLERWERAGALPVGSFAQLALEPILSPVHSTLNHLEPLLALWQPAVQSLEIRLTLADTEIEDWLGNLWQLQEGHPGFAQITTSPLAVTRDGQPRWHRLTGLWVTHLAANAAGIALQSWLSGPDDSVLLPPLPKAEAESQLAAIVEGWRAAMNAPLPLACQTACDYLDMRDSKDEDAAERAARQSFEGGYNRVGERDRQPALARAWPDFDTLWEHREAFVKWAETLYQPLREHAQVVHVSHIEGESKKALSGEAS